MKQMLLKQYSVSILFYPMIIYLFGYFAPISSKAHNNIFYILVLLPFILWVKKKEILNLLKSRIVLITVVFTGYLAMRSLFYLPLDFSEIKDPFRHLVSFWVFFAVAVSMLQHEAFKKMITYVALWAAVWGSVNAAIYYSHYHFSRRLLYNGPDEHAIIGACVYAVILIFILFGNNIKSQIVIFMSSTLLFALVLFSQSRGPLLSLVVALFVGSACRWRKWGVVAPFVFCAIFFIVHQQGWGTFNRLFKSTSGYRFQIWQEVIGASWKNGDWLFGKSLLADHTVTVGKLTFDHPHSGYVATFFHGGILGFGLLIILMVVVGWHAIKLWQSERNGLAIALYVFSGLIIVTDSHKLLHGPGALWVYFWLPLAYIAAHELRMFQDQAGDNSLV